MRRLWATEAVIALCLASWALPALAQETSPTPVHDAAPALVTGIEHCSIDTGTTDTGADGVMHYRGGRATCTHEADDPRVSGAVDYTWDADLWPAGGVQWGAGTISNDGGTWEGTYSGVVSDPTQGDAITFWLKGAGDYAGLSYYYRVTGSGPWEVTGLIFPGDPPAPSLSGPASE